MGFVVDVMAIGPFSPDIAHLFEHPPHHYEKLETGTTVVRCFFPVLEGSRSCFEVASYFGVDALDFSSHCLKPENADIEKLCTRFGEDEVSAFLIFVKKGFTFYFRTN